MRAEQTDEDKAGHHVCFKCPSCEQMVTMRKMLTPVRADEGNEGEAGRSRLADIRCPECEATLSLEAPRGHRWASGAAHFFSRQYGRVILANRLRHGTQRVM